MNQPVLKVEHLKKYYPIRKGAFSKEKAVVKACDDVSFELYAGETLGIVGESGCGKSMIARSVMGLLKYPGRITGGSIRLAGQELVGLPDSQMQRIRGKDVSMIFQEPMTSLNPVVPVGKQMREALLLQLVMFFFQLSILVHTVSTNFTLPPTIFRKVFPISIASSSVFFSTRVRKNLCNLLAFSPALLLPHSICYRHHDSSR